MLASSLKRALLRKDSTFSEADYGFRAFGELLRHLDEPRGSSSCPRARPGAIRWSSSPQTAAARTGAFELLARGRGRTGVTRTARCVLSGSQESGCANEDPAFSEKKFGYGGFLQFCKAAATKGVIELTWDDGVGDYRVSAK